MFKYLISFLLIALGCVYALPVDAKSVVGYVHVDSWDLSPEQAYELHRDGRVVGSLYQDMPVRNNDLIVPKAGGGIFIEYISHECPEVEVRSATRVYCSRQADEPGFWNNVYDKLNIFSPKVELEETQGTTLREACPDTGGQEIKQGEAHPSGEAHPPHDELKKTNEEKW
ncbi:hypothetical protein [Maridesulfovibrio sp. FT414]|uniref:hypothetical protein n=1 Tax=Maridesulfovibrio sp. FT414 TaxID=2979469 RepID=UPI003D804B7E